jgi:hypothetical protein
VAYPQSPAAGVGSAFLVLALGHAAGSLAIGVLAETGVTVAFLSAASSHSPARP